MKRKMLVMCMALTMTVLGSTTVMAGNWMSDSTGWWYQEDDNSYPANTWKWIDSNNDGVSECYYFDANGYLLVNGTTPDNSVVDQDGAWIVDGVVQHQAKDTTLENQSRSINPAIAEDFGLTFGELKSKYGEFKTRENQSLGEYKSGGYHTGTSVCFINSSLTSEVERSDLEIRLNVPASLTYNYTFWEKEDELNDNCRLYSISFYNIGSKNVFNGFSEKTELDEFVKEIRQLGAVDIKVLNEDIEYSVVEPRGTSKETVHPVVLGFRYQNVWFYLRGEYEDGKAWIDFKKINFSTTGCFLQKNKKHEEMLNKSFWNEARYRGWGILG